MSSKSKCYNYNEVVLGIVGRYPPWPARVVSVQTAPSAAFRKQGVYMVTFFGTNDFRHLTRKDNRDFNPDVATLVKGSLSVAYQEAIQFNAQQSLTPDDQLDAPSATDGIPIPVATLEEEAKGGTVPSTSAGAGTDPSTSGQPSFGIKPAPRRHRQLSACSSSGSEDPDYVPDHDSDFRESAQNSDSEESVEPGVSNSAQPDPLSAILDDVIRQALDDTPKPKRRKVAEPSSWKKNAAKAARVKGEPYVDYKERSNTRREPLQVDCNKCPFKCGEKFNHEERVRVCETYYALGDFVRKNDFLLKRMTLCQPKRPAKEVKTKNRDEQWQYSLCKESGEEERVCKKFLQATLGMTSDAAFRTARKYRGDQGEFIGKDMRGHVTPTNKTTMAQEAKVGEHIMSFPVVPPHYVRRDRNRTYLLPGLNKSKMYDLYRQWCAENGTEDAVSKEIYIRIFNEKFNIGFFVPKKDQCLTCARRNDLSGDELNEYVSKVYGPHIQRHITAQQEKLRDKQKASSDRAFHSATFDLQSVLYTPCSDVSMMYYRRKFAVYNLTVYQQCDPHDADCYLWDECTGKRGSNEICSALLAYLSQLPSCVRHVTLFSDTCGGQNRNHLTAAGLLFHVVNSPTIEIIDQKYLESGHSYMECDSMHSAIEFAKKYQKIYVPEEWDNIITAARRNKPYRVHHLNQNNIFDIRRLAQELITNRKKNTLNEKVNWMVLKWIRYDKKFPFSIFYKVDYHDEFKEIRIENPRGCRASSGAPGNLSLVPAYSSQLSISSAKKADLVALVNAGAIPSHFRFFYESLPSSDTVQERLAEPHADETEECQ